MFDVFSQKNRILLRELIKTDFKLRYQGSAIGYLWSILKPLMMFSIMYVVFVRFLRFDDGTPHYAVGLLLSMIFLDVLYGSNKYGNVVYCFKRRFATQIEFS